MSWWGEITLSDRQRGIRNGRQGHFVAVSSRHVKNVADKSRTVCCHFLLRWQFTAERGERRSDWVKFTALPCARDWGLVQYLKILDESSISCATFNFVCASDSWIDDSSRCHDRARTRFRQTDSDSSNCRQCPFAAVDSRRGRNVADNSCFVCWSCFCADSWQRREEERSSHFTSLVFTRDWWLVQ